MAYIICLPFRLSAACGGCLLQLKFEDDLQITVMFSGEGEEVPFREVMYPRGNVEDWLLEVERVMMESLRKIMEEALEDYKTVGSPSCPPT